MFMYEIRSEIYEIIKFHNFKFFFFTSGSAFGHTIMNTPRPIRTVKLSMLWPR